MKTTELEALQNAADGVGLTIATYCANDKRKKIKYIAKNGSQWVSPILSYNQLNAFLLGWIKATQKY